MVRIIEDLTSDWRRPDERVEDLSNEIEAIARQDGGCGRLMSVPGIGPIISSAMVPAIGAGDVFTKGRDFAAWLGLPLLRKNSRSALGHNTLKARDLSGKREEACSQSFAHVNRICHRTAQRQMMFAESDPTRAYERHGLNETSEYAHKERGQRIGHIGKAFVESTAQAG